VRAKFKEKMKHISAAAKTFGFLAFLSVVLWCGSYLTRLFLTYQLFDGIDLPLKDYVNANNLNGILITLIPAVTTTFILYILFILTFLIFLILSKVQLKREGWLFIITVIVFVTLPFEIFLMLKDYKIIMMYNSSSFDSNLVLQLTRERITSLSGFPLIQLFSYFAALYLILFKPLRMKKTDEN
jgi:hypothetical protein